MANKATQVSDTDIPVIDVQSPSQKQTLQKYPVSPKTAGLLATVVASPSGPLAPLIGLGTYLYTRRKEKNYNEAQAAYIENMRGEHKGLRDLIQRERSIATPEEARLLDQIEQMSTDGYLRLAANDSSGVKMIDQANALLSGLIQSDISFENDQRKEQYTVQRSLISNSALAYRNEAQDVINSANEMGLKVDRIFDLVNNPDFDPNKPLNKALLADLVEIGGLMFRDAPDALDALTQGSSALGNFGPWGAAGSSLVQGVSTYMKSEDFKVTPEDYNRIALNAKRFVEAYAKKKMNELATQAKSLDGWARERGMLPDDFSLSDYVTGGVKELRFNEPPQRMRLEHVPRQNQQERRRLLENPTDPNLGAEPWNQRHGEIRRPTN